MKLVLVLFTLLAACASEPPTMVAPGTNLDSADVQKEMCIEENIGVLRFSAVTSRNSAPSLKSQAELTCFRFVPRHQGVAQGLPGRGHRR